MSSILTIHSRRLQFPCVRDFSIVNRTDPRCFDSRNCHGISVRGGKFHLASETVPLNRHHRSNIARFQPFGAEIAFQNDSVCSLVALPFILSAAMSGPLLPCVTCRCYEGTSRSACFETRSLPALTRSYPRRFTFYVVDPSSPLFVVVTDRRRRQCHGPSRGAGLRPHRAAAGSIEIFPVARARGVTIVSRQLPLRSTATLAA